MKNLDTVWLENYFTPYRDSSFNKLHYGNLIAFRDLVLQVRERGNKLIFAGNGASASIASHARVDFTKQAKCKSIDFNEPNLITALANDYGFENFMTRATEFFAEEGDVLVLISVSGSSPNCVRAAEYARSRGLKLVTFTGKSFNNPLRKLSDIDFWLDSNAYNIVECTHMIWICTVVDMVIGKAEYSVN
ncbi:MAG: SIS domain-containing protein [Balneolales bacterium]